MKKIIFLFIICTNLVFANFQKAEKIFTDKCKQCHKEFIPLSQVKENFFEKNNQLLKLKAPTLNMMIYAITKSPKAFTIDDDELNQEALADFLMNYLAKPDLSQNICDDVIIKYYDKKTPMKISEEEAMELANFFLKYEQKHKEEKKQEKMFVDERFFLSKAQKENKKILLYITSKSCHYCKEMDKKVLSLKNIKEKIDKNFIFIEVVVENIEIPFNAKEHYPQITPTFIFLDKNAKFLNSIPGAWKEKDFLQILNENK